MNARGKLMRRLGYTIPLGVAEMLVNNFAHELAEEIRKDLGGDDLYPRERETGALLAADRIDPYKEK